MTSRETERVLLAASAAKAAELAPLLDSFTEGQSRPQELLALLAPGLAWNWLFEGTELPGDVLGFLAGWMSANAGMRQMLEGFVEEQGTALARDLKAGAHALARLITRARRLELSIYWWEAQNLVMADPKRCVHEELCQLLNLSLPGE